mgnify:CR=1 FL=1
MKTKLIASSLLSFNSHALEQKVLLRGIDGGQFENIAKIHTPGFDRLTTNKAYTVGITDTQSQQNTKSGPGWATI